MIVFLDAVVRMQCLDLLSAVISLLATLGFLVYGGRYLFLIWFQKKRSSVCTLWITSTDFYLVITFRLFIMLHRFPIESASRHKKLQEVCKFVTLFFFLKLNFSNGRICCSPWMNYYTNSRKDYENITTTSEEMGNDMNRVLSFCILFVHKCLKHIHIYIHICNGMHGWFIWQVGYVMGICCTSFLIRSFMVRFIYIYI